MRLTPDYLRTQSQVPRRRQATSTNIRLPVRLASSAIPHQRARAGREDRPRCRCIPSLPTPHAMAIHCNRTAHMCRPHPHKRDLQPEECQAEGQGHP